MKRVVCLMMLVSLVGLSVAGSGFIGGVNGRWDDPTNWTAGVVPQDSTTNPGSATPAWNNDAEIRNGNTALIDSATAAEAYGLNIGLYGATSGVNVTGGSLTVGNWGLNVGRGGNGNQGHVGSHGTLHVSGGVVTAPYINLPQNWGTDPVIQGTMIMDGGTVNAGWMKLGGDNGVGVGTLTMNSGVINLTDWLDILGTDSLIAFAAGSDAVINIHHVDFEGSLQAELDKFQGFIDAGYITGAGVSYDAGAENIVLAVPEPATLGLLAIGGLLLRRKK